MKNGLFNSLSEAVLLEMENMARKIGISGAGAIACLEDASAKTWTARMTVVNKVRSELSPDGKTGYNYVAIAFSKLGEMMDTLQDSGSGARPLLNGEIGYRGGAIRKHEAGYIAAAFSGGSAEQDYDISLAALEKLGVKL